LFYKSKLNLKRLNFSFKASFQDAVSNEITQAAEVIKAEATSQSWLPRNVRPLLLLLWGVVITINQLVPIIARFWIPGLMPFPVDPWFINLQQLGLLDMSQLALGKKLPTQITNF